MVLGLGTGSTVRHLLEHIAEQREMGEWPDIVGVPTSEETRRQAIKLGIPVATLAEEPDLDLTIDGADEVDPELGLIKGGGGALLREKIVATASARVVIIVDESKLVERLGVRWALPVEVDPFGGPVQPEFFRSLGAQPSLRRDADGAAFVTDGGNHIYDLAFLDGIRDPSGTEIALNNRPGVLENGLFIDLADHVVVARESGIQILDAER